MPYHGMLGMAAVAAPSPAAPGAGGPGGARDPYYITSANAMSSERTRYAPNKAYEYNSVFIRFF